MRSLAALLILIPTAALAQSDWSIAHESGVAVMDQSSVLTFRVTNLATGNNLTGVTLQLDKNQYEIEGGIAPPGWTVSTIDKQNKNITFTSAPCVGLAKGASALFGLRVTAAIAANDVSTDSFDTNGNGKTFVRHGCSGNSTSNLQSNNAPKWTRAGLAASLNVSPRALDLNGVVTATLVVTNQTTTNQNVISPSLPRVGQGDSASFIVSSGPMPPSVNLAPGESGTFRWTLTATGRGLARIRTSASNSTASSPEAQSALLNVGEFPGEVSATPDRVTSGSTVTVSLTVANNSSEPYVNIVPVAPTLTGTATGFRLTGPEPASISSLSPGAAARFKWTYQMTGNAGDAFTFTTQASAIRDDVSISTDPVSASTGEIVMHTVSAAPFALPAGSTTSRTITYRVWNGGAKNLTKVALIIPSSVSFPNPSVPMKTGWTATQPGGNPKTFLWTASGNGIPPAQSETFDVTYSGTGNPGQTTTFAHRWILTDSAGSTARAEADVTLFVSRVVPDVGLVGAVSGVNRNTLTWNNPVDHSGVLILRATGASPSAIPTMGAQYAVGATLGNAKVVYADDDSFTSNFTDTGLTNGTRYFYKIYNHDEFYVYSSGNAPSSSGIFSEPTSRISPAPLWCYSFGFPSTLQPVTLAGTSLFTSSNAGTVTASTISSNVAIDGQERWRPARLRGSVQNRFVVGDFLGLNGKHLLTGDQGGYAYAINASTGGIEWTALGGAKLGDAIQAQPAVQFRQFSNAAFQQRNPGRDLVFFATRNASPTSNRVFAISTATGEQVWSYAKGDLDIVSGGLAVDYARNELWVASRAGSNGTQASLRVISTLDGSEIARFSNVGDVDLAVTFAYQASTPKYALVANNAGVVFGFDLETKTLAWSHPVGVMTEYPFDTGNGFIAPLANGTLQRFALDPTTLAVTPMWSAPPSVPNPSGIRIEYATQKLYVGDSLGRLHQIDVLTGVDEKQVALSTTQVGMPTIDLSMTPKRLHVGLSDGRVCALEVPF